MNSISPGASTSQAPAPKKYPWGIGLLMELFDIGPVVAMAVVLGSIAIIVAAIVMFIASAPPDHLTIASGPEGSNFYKNAVRYQKRLEKYGVKVTILTTDGSIDNLKRLSDRRAHVDVAFAQAGLKVDANPNLRSLASIGYQPIFVFYRGKPQELLSGFTGMRISVGPIDTGVHQFAMSMLDLNGIKPGGPTKLFELDSVEAAKQLLDGSLDAAFIMSENTAPAIVRSLERASDIRLFHFRQASAYTRKIEFLNSLELPQGGIDIGQNIPAQDVTLLGPMVELIANSSLHPALSDLLLEAAFEVHSRPGTYQRRGEFPLAVEHSIAMSDDATRYFQSGKTFLYRYMPFWLASLISRIMVSFLPMLVILIPVFQTIPMMFRWRMQAVMVRRYRELLRLEHAFNEHQTPEELEQIRSQFQLTEANVLRMNVPPAFADQFYGLRGHVDYVRGVIFRASHAPPSGDALPENV